MTMENLNNVLCFVYCLLSIIISLCITSFFMRLNIPNRRKLVIGILFLDFIFNLLIVSNVSNVSNRLKLSILYLFVFISFILAIIISLYYNRQIDYTRIFRNVRPFSVFLLTISVGYIIVRLMVHKFNDDSWWINENNISNSIDKWGDFATFFGGIFALISIYLAYRAFISQVNAARRASFDATFTQIFAQHKILYDKAMQHNNKVLFVSDYNKKCIKGSVNKNIFYICKNEYNEYISIIRTSGRSDDISEFWTRFNEQIGASVSVDFKNYLKYIHNEVEFVASQPDDILDNDAKQRYIQLIQAQMNNDELFCYLINKVEFMYRNQSNLEEDTRIHAEHLRNFRFFIELCRGRSGHVDFVRYLLRYNNYETTRLIDINWLS